MMQAARNADVVVIITNHKVYDYHAIVENSVLVFDTRNATQALEKGVEKVVRL
jgi:UDP-N-acetyl-D-glucosamine dehydrogenase